MGEGGGLGEACPICPLRIILEAPAVGALHGGIQLTETGGAGTIGKDRHITVRMGPRYAARAKLGRSFFGATLEPGTSAPQNRVDGLLTFRHAVSGCFGVFRPESGKSERGLRMNRKPRRCRKYARKE